jgi:hypothetical protein
VPASPDAVAFGVNGSIQFGFFRGAGALLGAGALTVAAEFEDGGVALTAAIAVGVGTGAATVAGGALRTAVGAGRGA